MLIINLVSKLYYSFCWMKHNIKLYHIIRKEPNDGYVNRNSQCCLLISTLNHSLMLYSLYTTSLFTTFSECCKSVLKPTKIKMFNLLQF